MICDRYETEQGHKEFHKQSSRTKRVCHSYCSSAQGDRVFHDALLCVVCVYVCCILVNERYQSS